MEAIRICLETPLRISGEQFFDTINGGHTIVSILQDGNKTALLTKRGRPGKARQDLPLYQIFAGQKNDRGITVLKQVGTILEGELHQATKSLAWFFVSKSFHPKTKEEQW